MQPHSQNPNPNPNRNPNLNHQHHQHHHHHHHHHLLHFHHHCPPFPHLHIPVSFCPHHHCHLHLHLHHPHSHASQLPCNSALRSSSYPSAPSPLSQTPPFNQINQGQGINHAAVSDLELPPQELATSDILEDNEEEEDVFVLTDEWAEFFAKSEAKRQLAKQNKKKGRK